MLPMFSRLCILDRFATPARNSNFATSTMTEVEKNTIRSTRSGKTIKNLIATSSLVDIKYGQNFGFYLQKQQADVHESKITMT